MVVHRIKLFYSKNGASAFHTWLQTWDSNRASDTADGLVNDIPAETVSPQDAGDSEYYAVSLSYQFSEAFTTVFDEPYNSLQNNCSWCRIAYHKCEHDEATPTACEYEQKQDHGTVPSYVPTIDINTQ
jgi:hypothetical protein